MRSFVFDKFQQKSRYGARIARKRYNNYVIDSSNYNSVDNSQIVDNEAFTLAKSVMSENL